MDKLLNEQHKTECREYSTYEPTIEVECAKSRLSTPVHSGIKESTLVQHRPLRAPKRPTNRVISTTPRTLADVMEMVESSPDLAWSKRRDVLSALRTLARCLDKPPSQISAAPKSLQHEIATVNYHQVGLSKSRWINTKSLARKGLQAAGINIMPGRRANSVFSPAWAQLRDQCCPSHQMGLSRFMNYCSDLGIEPDAVSEVALAQFENELRTNSLELDADKIYRQTRRIWDKASATVAEWPAFRTGMATQQRSYSRPWSCYPQAFLDDVEAFLARGSVEHCEVDLDEQMPMLRPATIKGRRINLRLMANALAESGVPVDQFDGLTTLVQPKNAKQIIQFFMRRNGGKTKEGIYGYASLLRTIAKYWVKADHQTIDALTRYCKKAAAVQRGMVSSNREKLRQFDDPANVLALYSLPAKLMKLARAAEKGSYAAFCYAVYAIAIEILLRTALRIENLHSLSLIENITMPTDLRDGEVIIEVPRHAVKNDQDLRYALPPEFGRMLREYLTDFRFDRAAGGPWLFPNKQGGRRNKDGFAQQLKAVVYRHTGIIVNVHLYRGLMVKTYMEVHPHDIETPSKMLGHTDTRTTARAYCEGNTLAGQREFANIIDAKRQQVEHTYGHRRRN